MAGSIIDKPYVPEGTGSTESASTESASTESASKPVLNKKTTPDITPPKHQYSVSNTAFTSTKAEIRHLQMKLVTIFNIVSGLDTKNPQHPVQQPHDSYRDVLDAMITNTYAKIKDPSVYISAIGSVGQDGDEKKPDGIWNVNTHRALAAVAYAASSVLKSMSAIGIESTTLSQEDFVKFLNVLNKTTKLPVTDKKIVSEMDRLLDKFTAFFKEFRSKAESVTSKPAADIPGIKPASTVDNLATSNKQHASLSFRLPTNLPLSGPVRISDSNKVVIQLSDLSSVNNFIEWAQRWHITIDNHAPNHTKRSDYRRIFDRIKDVLLNPAAYSEFIDDAGGAAPATKTTEDNEITED